MNMEDETLEKMTCAYGLIGTITIESEFRKENRRENGYLPENYAYLHFKHNDQIIVTEMASSETVLELERELQQELNELNAAIQKDLYVKREGNLLRYTNS
tara:strand:- start:40262 stop:40564 length:303 start_codon:yes stop_codon:yes gene_type:complete